LLLYKKNGITSRPLALTAEWFDGGVVGAKGTNLAVFSPFETGDTENPLLFGGKGQYGGCAISARAVFLNI
jgi:hypothetical protein